MSPYARSYAVCEVWVTETDVNRVRRAIRPMCRPGQRRLHFGKEQDGRQREVLARLAALPIYAQIVVAHGNRVASRLVQDDWDRRVIYSELLRLDAELPYEHLHAFEEAMLWASDAIAWAYMAGGDWRDRLSGLVDKAVAAPK
jgi:hypothetical protein